jgi:hypothetical protein
LDPNDPLVSSTLMAHDEIARRDLGADYDEVVECTTEIISNNPVYLEKIYHALLKGENVAKLTYELIKGDPAFTKTLPIAQARLKASGKVKAEEKPKEEAPAKEASAEAKAAQEALESNKNKKQTSAHVEGSDKPATFDGYTLQQLNDMSDKEFAKVPKKIREAFLKGDLA